MSSAPAQVADNQIVIHSPLNGVEIGRVRVMTATEVREAVARARVAQAEWAEVPLRDRVRRVRRFRDELIAHAQELADLIVAENGKTPEEALFMELLPLAHLSSWFCAKARKALRPRRIRAWGASLTRRSYVHYAPRGVVAVITPWNLPLLIPAADAIQALLAGNAVLIKPSEWTPLTAVRIQEVFEKSGLPSDLLQVITGSPATGAALIDAGVDKVQFTGSTAAGKKVAAACGERLIPCTLELGGKAPAIVCRDANLDRTVNSIVYGAFANSGQACLSVERVLVDKAIAPELTRRLTAEIARLRQGDPTVKEVDVGAMTFPKQVEIIERLVDDARGRGATVVTGGKRLEGKGRYYAPTLLTGVTPDMPLAREEIFGPVLPVIEVADEEEAIRLANESHLGLNAYVFTRDRRRARRIAERIHAGTVMANDVLGNYAFPELPFGGVKQSGLGIAHGIEGLRSMCEPRVVNYDRFPPFRKDLWMYPYSRRLSGLLMAQLPRITRIFDALGWT